eukprot:COSAG01_NODE_71999_length_254_cov_0.670968_1_plen_62_part_01
MPRLVLSRNIEDGSAQSILAEMYLCPACSWHEIEGEHAWTGVHCALTQAAGGCQHTSRHRPR